MNCARCTTKRRGSSCVITAASCSTSVCYFLVVMTVPLLRIACCCLHSNAFILQTSLSLPQTLFCLHTTTTTTATTTITVLCSTHARSCSRSLPDYMLIKDQCADWADILHDAGCSERLCATVDGKGWQLGRPGNSAESVKEFATWVKEQQADGGAGMTVNIVQMAFYNGHYKMVRPPHGARFVCDPQGRITQEQTLRMRRGC